LHRFRATHPITRAAVNRIEWEYIASGRGDKAVMVLPGLLGAGEMSFEHILAFEDACRVIAPSYPLAITSLPPLISEIVGVLDAEGIDRVQVLGGSYGGLAAQYLVRQYPDRVGTLILSHTRVPRPDRAAKNQRFVAIVRLLPTDLLRVMLRLATRQSLADAPMQRAFWKAYSNEVIDQITKTDLLSRYRVAVDCDAFYAFAPQDLEGWPGRILILEGDNDPVAESRARGALRA
jgi:pimeloyl-ACP methyl ester carboxylesterase